MTDKEYVRLIKVLLVEHDICDRTNCSIISDIESIDNDYNQDKDAAVRAAVKASTDFFLAYDQLDKEDRDYLMEFTPEGKALQAWVRKSDTTS